MTKLDHVAIAVRSIAQAQVLYQLLDFDLSTVEEIAQEGVRAMRIPPGRVPFKPEGAGLELLEPLEKDSPLGRFLGNREGALHHIAFQVDNIEEVLDQMKQSGIKLTFSVIRNLPGGGRYFFIHPSSAGGILIEICQAPKAVGDQDG